MRKEYTIEALPTHEARGNDKHFSILLRRLPILPMERFLVSFVLGVSLEVAECGNCDFDTTFAVLLYYVRH